MQLVELLSIDGNTEENFLKSLQNWLVFSLFIFVSLKLYFFRNLSCATRLPLLFHEGIYCNNVSV